MQRPLRGVDRVLFALGACFSLGAVLAVACAQFAPPHDPSAYPCGSPRMHFCPVRVDGERTCCWEGQDCGGSIEFPGCPAGMCCANGFAAAGAPDAGARQVVEAPAP